MASGRVIAFVLPLMTLLDHSLWTAGQSVRKPTLSPSQALELRAGDPGGRSSPVSGGRIPLIRGNKGMTKPPSLEPGVSTPIPPTGATEPSAQKTLKELSAMISKLKVLEKKLKRMTESSSTSGAPTTSPRPTIPTPTAGPEETARPSQPPFWPTSANPGISDPVATFGPASVRTLPPGIFSRTSSSPRQALPSAPRRRPDSNSRQILPAINRQPQMWPAAQNTFNQQPAVTLIPNQFIQTQANQSMYREQAMSNAQQAMPGPNRQQAMSVPNRQQPMPRPNRQQAMSVPNRQQPMPGPNQQQPMPRPNRQQPMPGPNRQQPIPGPYPQQQMPGQLPQVQSSASFQQPTSGSMAIDPTQNMFQNMLLLSSLGGNGRLGSATRESEFMNAMMMMNAMPTGSASQGSRAPSRGRQRSPMDSLSPLLFTMALGSNNNNRMFDTERFAESLFRM